MTSVTIVTVSYNAASTIEQTLNSVIGQCYRDIEHIVVDGGSTDRTVDIITSVGSGIAKWISEPDHGIADAMNKGLRLATGDYILYLNADDYLVDSEAIERVSLHLDREVVAAPIIKLERDGSQRTVNPRGLNWWLNFKTGLFHQATLCARRMLVDLGGFDTRLKLTMDYDLFLRAYRRGCSAKVIDQPFSVMRSGGASTRNDTAGVRNRLSEEEMIHFRHCPGSFMRAVYSVYWMVYPRYRMLRAVEE